MERTRSAKVEIYERQSSGHQRQEKSLAGHEEQQVCWEVQVVKSGVDVLMKRFSNSVILSAACDLFTRLPSGALQKGIRQRYMEWCWTSAVASRLLEATKLIPDTVDGRNPAPVDKWFIPWIIGFQPSKVVQDFVTIHSSLPMAAIVSTIFRVLTWVCASDRQLTRVKQICNLS